MSSVAPAWSQRRSVLGEDGRWRTEELTPDRRWEPAQNPQGQPRTGDPNAEPADAPVYERPDGSYGPREGGGARPRGDGRYETRDDGYDPRGGGAYRDRDDDDGDRYGSPRDDGYRGFDFGGFAGDGNDQLRRLEAVLERYRAIERRGGWKPLPADLTIGPGHQWDCSRVEAVERRMIAEGYLDRPTTPPPPPPAPAPPPPSWYEREKPPPPKPRPRQCSYSRELEEAVRNFQADRRVLGVGQVGKLTTTEMNRPVGEIVDMIEHDIRRWRSYRLDPSGTYLLVNIPFYELIAYEEGRERLRFPVIVGLPSWQTPTFDATVQYLVVNPSWGIPENIAKLEYWPSARKNPKWLANQGITAEGGQLRQKPGPNNPLGRIKFIMPNPHDVYLHDTPHKGAFKAAVKALSHGCVRLSQPMDLANYLLAGQPEAEKLDRLLASRQTQQVNLARKMPVHIVYSTTRVNDEGRLEVRKDVYGKNARSRRSDQEVPEEDRRFIDSGP